MLRVLPGLIRLSSAIKPNTSAKTNYFYPNQSLKKLRLEASPITVFKNMSTDIDKELNDPKRHFDYDQLIQKMDKENAIVIDVREHEEVNETGKIPGSIHIPLNELKTALMQLSCDEFFNSYQMNKPNFDDEVIFTCRSGRRSLTALKTAYELGWQKAGNYKGGWKDWSEKSKLSQ